MLKSKDLQLVTVSENTSTGRALLGEWGLSVLVKAAGHHILMDTGASSSVCQNIDSLGVDLDRVEAIVLSHGHSDHTGGLRPLLLKMQEKEMKIIAHPAVWGRKYGKNRKTGVHRYAGMPYNREDLESLGARFSLTSEPTWITDDVVTSGEEPMVTDFEGVADNLLLREDSRYVPDPMADDQSIFVKTEVGLVIVLGCAHRGIINIIRHAQKLTGEDRVYMVIGGTHLGPASEQQATRTIAALKEIGFQWLGVSHCTGLKVAARLDQEFGDRFFYNNVGTTIDFPFVL
jgi:7,8-dihydropterin-6-yl-methyl-4-(beta-D-ribofuranosyl)aminobenzene 5'-phosphate synthase